MPPPFANGLAVCRARTAPRGTATYDGAADAAFVPRTRISRAVSNSRRPKATQRLRYSGETMLLPGCYLRVRARVKAMSGNLPGVGSPWAGGAGGPRSPVSSHRADDAAHRLCEIVEVSAIIGVGQRMGVDMVWGAAALYGHFGLDLTGATGGGVRIDDIVIEDVTGVFHRKMMDWVDVVDFGAVGDGVTDDSAAFEAADAAAAGGTCCSGRCVFPRRERDLRERGALRGGVTMPDTGGSSASAISTCPTYIDAFGDEGLAFRKAFQGTSELSRTTKAWTSEAGGSRSTGRSIWPPPCRGRTTTR